MAEGYIKLHRQLLDSYQFSNPNNLKIWIWMLLKANYVPKTVSIKVSQGYTDVLVQRGQFVFGRHKAALELDLDDNMIYRSLKKFELDGSICIKSNNQYSIITICKYDDYNKKEEQDEQPVNSQRTASEQPVGTTKKDKKGKEGKEEDIYSDFSFFNNGFEEVWKSFKEHRVRIKKPLTKNAEKLNLVDLDKLCKSNKEEAIKLVNHAIKKGWQTFYPIKDDMGLFEKIGVKPEQNIELEKHYSPSRREPVKGK